MRLSEKYGGIQFFAPEVALVYVNGSKVFIYYRQEIGHTWSERASLNTENL